jgi:hypothetical protein
MAAKFTNIFYCKTLKNYPNWYSWYHPATLMSLHLVWAEKPETNIMDLEFLLCQKFLINTQCLHARHFA